MVRLHTRLLPKLVFAFVVLLPSCLAVIPSAAQDQPASQTAPAQNSGYPVNVDGREVLRVFESVGSFSAQERADAISARLQKLVNDPAADLNQIKVVDTTFGTSIELGDNVLMVVTDNDAHRLQVSRSVVAAYYLKQIRQGIAVARQQHSKEFLVWAAIYAVVTLAIYLLLLWIVVAGFRRLLKVLQPAVAHMKGIKIQQSELLKAGALLKW